MSKKWQEIFADKTAFPDDFTLSDKDGNTFTLGDARAYNTETEGKFLSGLEKRDKDLKAREGNISNAEKAMMVRLKEAAEAAGVSVSDFVEGKFSKRSVAAAEGLDEDDPLVGKYVKQYKEDIKSLREEIKSLKEKGIGPVINTYLEDYYEGKLDKLFTDLPKGAKFERKDVLAYAEKEGMKDSKGRLNLEKAFHEMTADARMEIEIEKRTADRLKKADDERKLASIREPQSGARAPIAKQFKDDKGRTKSIEQVLQDSLQDDAIWQQVGQA